MSTPGKNSSGPLLAIGISIGLLAYWSGWPGSDVSVDVLPLMNAGKFEQALMELEAIEARGDEGSGQIVNKSICLVALGEHPKAVRTLLSGIITFPEEHSLTLVLADIYLSLGQPRLAKAVLRDARERGARDEVISVPLAICLGKKGDYEEALVELERAERDGASLTDVGYNKSLIFLKEGRASEAKELLEAVLEQSGEHLAALREHARALVMTSEGEHDERLDLAISQVNQVLLIRTKDWRAYEVLGDAFLAQADPVAAIAAYTEALRFGRNPAEVEDKYRVAAVRARQLHGDAVDLPTVKPERSLPPLPPSMEGLEDLLRGSRG
jgi:tetratricopeptide (TPR) repeat protein